MIRKQAEDLEGIVKSVLLAAGASESNATIVAKHLVLAELSGVQTHGLFQVPNYLKDIEGGGLIPTAEPEVIEDDGAKAVVSGNRSFGHVGAEFAVRLGTEKARSVALAVVGLVRVNHIGRLGHYAEIAAGEGLICLIWGGGYGRVTPRAVPFGGRDQVLDTNPIAMGIPSGSTEGRAPIIIDFATTHGSAVKVMNAQRRGETLPEGVIVDATGLPTTDPNDFHEGGSLAPFGGHKGYAIMFAAEVLGRIFSGADAYVDEAAGPFYRHQGVTFLLMRADSLTSMPDFTGRVDDLVDRVTGSRPAEGVDRVLYPGQKEAETRAEWSREGIPIADDIWERFVDGAKSVGVEL